MKDNPLLDQSLVFASSFIKLQKYLLKEKNETIISKQIIRSSTSIGAKLTMQIVNLILSLKCIFR